MTAPWILTFAGIGLITIVPLLAVSQMRRRRAKIIYPVWFTAGSSAAGYCLLVQGTLAESSQAVSFEIFAFIMLVWWLYLAVVSEAIHNSWQRIAQEQAKSSRA